MPDITKYCFLLPAYKAKFLDAAIQSILNQTYPYFQLVISDDCSPENLMTVVEKYLKDTRVSYRRNDTNLGADRLVDHWNLLLGQCESEYVIVASDDDVYALSFLETVEKAVCTRPEADIIRVRAHIINEKGEVIKTDPECLDYWSMEEFLHHFINPNSVLCIGNFVFKTETLKRLGGFVKFPLGWKSDTATEIMMSSNGVACVEDCLFSFRMSGMNISSNGERNFVRDSAKLEAILQFGEWIKPQFSGLKSEDMMLEIFRNRLEGEARSYYWTADRKSFAAIYNRMSRDEWFRTFRNKVSFLVGWIKSR